MANKSLRSRLRRLFSTNVIVRRIGKKRLQVVDSNKLQSLGSMRNSRYIDRFSGMHTNKMGYNTYNQSYNFHSSKVEVFIDYELWVHRCASVGHIFQDFFVLFF